MESNKTWDIIKCLLKTDFYLSDFKNGLKKIYFSSEVQEKIISGAISQVIGDNKLIKWWCSWLFQASGEKLPHMHINKLLTLL